MQLLPELDELALVLLAFWCSRVGLALLGRFSFGVVLDFRLAWGVEGLFQGQAKSI